jgi:hypothetical protein
MQRLVRRLSMGLLFAGCFAEAIFGQQAGRAEDHDMAASAGGIRKVESHVAGGPHRHRRIAGRRDHGLFASQPGSHGRPGPDQSFQQEPVDKYSPFSEALPFVSGSYLHERQHKRELRLESAQKGTAIAQSQLADQERTLLFTLRGAFVQALQPRPCATWRRRTWLTSIMP